MAEPLRRIGDGGAMITAGRRRNARLRHRAREQIVERPARLERAGVLQKLELESERILQWQTEIGRIDANDRRAANMRLDARISRPNVILPDHMMLSSFTARRSAIRS